MGAVEVAFPGYSNGESISLACNNILLPHTHSFPLKCPRGNEQLELHQNLKGSQLYITGYHHAKRFRWGDFVKVLGSCAPVTLLPWNDHNLSPDLLLLRDWYTISQCFFFQTWLFRIAQTRHPSSSILNEKICLSSFSLKMVGTASPILHKVEKILWHCVPIP